MWPGRGKGLKNIGIGVVGDTALGRRRPVSPRRDPSGGGAG